MTNTAVRIVRCPQCGGDSEYHAGNPYRPFCGARCKGVDLGAWASESFRVAARPDPLDDADFLDASDARAQGLIPPLQ